jgi:hypothetical protein
MCVCTPSIRTPFCGKPGCGTRVGGTKTYRYVARPVEVTALMITMVVCVPPGSDCSGYHLLLEDGTGFRPTAEMCARMTPKCCDYLVTQADGYQYLNPKEVFERKYQPAA